MFTRANYDNGESFITSVLGSYAYGDTTPDGGERVKNEDASLIHVRHMQKITSNKLVAEFFIQNNNNDFTDIKNRLLAGADIRYTAYESKKYGNIYLALGAYHENIKYTTVLDEEETNTRVASYLAYKFTFDDDSRIDYMGYYQPKVDDFSDFYSSQALSLQVHIFINIFLKIGVSYIHDSNPVIGIEKTDIQQTNTLVWKF